MSEQKQEQQLDPTSFEYISPDSIHTVLICSICSNPFFNPITHNSCGNTYCRGCVAQIRDNCCPLCRVSYTNIDDSFRSADRVTIHLLDEIPVRCIKSISTRAITCNYQCKRSELVSHQSKCSRLPCPNNCGAFFDSESDIKLHLDDLNLFFLSGCGERIDDCVIGTDLLGDSNGCGWRGKDKDFYSANGHQTSCPLWWAEKIYINNAGISIKEVGSPFSEFRLGIMNLATELTTAKHQLKLSTEELTAVKIQLTQNQTQSDLKVNEVNSIQTDQVHSIRSNEINSDRSNRLNSTHQRDRVRPYPDYPPNSVNLNRISTQYPNVGRRCS